MEITKVRRWDRRKVGREKAGRREGRKVERGKVKQLNALAVVLAGVVTLACHEPAREVEQETPVGVDSAATPVPLPPDTIMARDTAGIG